MKDKKKLDTEETRGNVPHLKDIYKKRYGSGWETQYKKDVDWVIKYLTGICEKIDKLRDCCKDSYIQNQIDTVCELVNSTLYKLKFLK